MPSTPTQRCASCGLLILDEEDRGGGTPDSPRCRICTGPDGSPLDWEGAMLAHIAFLRSKSGASPEQAEAAAREILSGNPAWEDRRED